MHREIPDCLGEEVYGLCPPFPMADPRILLVEDDKIILELVSAFLAYAGYPDFIAVSRAGDARKAWAAHSESLELILTDLTLPDGTGSDLVRDFLEEKSTCRAIIMTGFTAEFVDLGSGKGDRAILLQKPFSRTEFIRLITACLGPAGGSD